MNTAYAPHKSEEYARPTLPAAKSALSAEAPYPSHPMWLGYIFWIFGFTGSHRFYYGRPLTGALWLFTGGLFLVGWIVDLFLIPSMAETASRRFPNGRIDYSVAWILHAVLGIFGAHRFYMGKIITGVVWLLTGGLFFLGYIYDTLTLNEQIDEINHG